MERERFSRSGIQNRRRNRKKKTEDSSNRLFYIQTIISFGLLIIGFIINNSSIEFLQPAKQAFATSLSKNADLSDISEAMNQFVDSIPVFKELFGEGFPVFNNKTEKENSEGNIEDADTVSTTNTDLNETENVEGENTPASTDGGMLINASAVDVFSDYGQYLVYKEENIPETAPPQTEQANTEAGQGQVEIQRTDPANTINKKIDLGMTLKKPLNGTITSEFGYREHPTVKTELFHYGLDIGAEEGKNIKAAAKGVVDDVGYSKSYGNYIIIKHSEDLYTFYGHCSKILVKKGSKVDTKTNIAKVGSTGISTGPHLHFEIKYKNQYVNPKLNIV